MSELLVDRREQPLRNLMQGIGYLPGSDMPAWFDKVLAAVVDLPEGYRVWPLAEIATCLGWLPEDEIQGRPDEVLAAADSLPAEGRMAVLERLAPEFGI